MANIDPKEFGDFRVDVLNHFDELGKSNAAIEKHLVKIETVLFGADGEPGKLKEIDKKFEKHDHSIDRIRNILWPMVGAIALLAWIGREGLKLIFK